MRRLYGRDAGHLVRNPPLDDEIADRLMSALDRRAAAADGVARMLVLRDKAMFATARRYAPTMPELLEMQIDKRLAAFDGAFSPRGPQRSNRRVEAMLDWYVHAVRPALAANEAASSKLFLTRAGRAMQPGALGMRFDQATRLAGLVHLIPNWSRWIAR